MTSNELEIFKQSILDEVKVMMQTTGQVTQYIGARYVPLFADPLEWSNTREYEPLTIVLNQGNSFTSRQFVPSGVDISNTEFWANTGNYNAQIEQYRTEMNKIKTDVVDIIKNNRIFTPEMMGYNSGDATTYINKALEAARGKGIVLLSGEYPITDTIHMSYYDNIYSVGKPKLITSAYPAVIFDIDTPTTYNRERTPFNGSNLTIIPSVEQIQDNPDAIGVELTNASEIIMSNLNIYYMGIAVKISGNNNYIITFRDCLFERNYYGVYNESNSNSGEKISYENCVFGHLYVSDFKNCEIAESNYINCSFDFCQNGIVQNVLSNENINFIGCHIEGLGYYGPDMPKKENDYYSKFVYAKSGQYVFNKYNFNGCFFHISQMQPKIGIPLMIDNTRSETVIESCSMSVKASTTLIKAQFTNGYCERGIVVGNCAYVGSKILPLPVVNGVQANVTKDFIEITPNSSDTNNIFNFPYLITPATSNHFIIDIEENPSSYSYNNTYSDNLTGLHEIVLSKPLTTIKCNMGSSGRVKINGIWFV